MCIVLWLKQQPKKSLGVARFSAYFLLGFSRCMILKVCELLVTVIKKVYCTYIRCQDFPGTLKIGNEGPLNTSHQWQQFLGQLGHFAISRKKSIGKREFPKSSLQYSYLYHYFGDTSTNSKICISTVTFWHFSQHFVSLYY